MDLWTAFLLGLFGSLHCLGMCGPLAIALPGTGAGRHAYAGQRVVYNVGRILTYAALGSLFGFVGQTLFLVGFQRGLSILVGSTLLIVVLIGPGRRARLTSIGMAQSALLALRSELRAMMDRRGWSTMFGIGILNGFLPCGLVYVALAGAVTTGSMTGGILYMTLFGVGTFPVMFGISMIGKTVQGRLRGAVQRAIPIVLVGMGTLLILRGMSLGIPFLSPDLAGGARCH
jgi:sulfite exporter TauE/SafE